VVAGGSPDCVLELRHGPIRERSTGRRRALRLPNGTISMTIGRCRSGFLVRFPGLAVFLVSRDGQRVSCARRRGTRPTIVSHLFLAQVLPRALSQRGRLVLHASAVATEHGAVAFLGAAGQGKSTLSASFVGRSFPLLTDDGLLLDVAHRTGKKRLTVDRGPWMFSRQPVPVRRMYVLGRAKATAHSRAVTITALTPREAFIELVKHTYRLDLDDRIRLRDEFDSISRIAARPSLIYRLAFRRDLSRLPAVQAAILEHCGS